MKKIYRDGPVNYDSKPWRDVCMAAASPSLAETHCESQFVILLNP